MEEILDVNKVNNNNNNNDSNNKNDDTVRKVVEWHYVKINILPGSIFLSTIVKCVYC